MPWQQYVLTAYFHVMIIQYSYIVLVWNVSVLNCDHVPSFKHKYSGSGMIIYLFVKPLVILVLS